MITPFFTIDQDDEFIYIDVKITHIRFSAQAIEMVVENELFIFSLHPYYVRIRLPFPCVDDERSHAQYDSKSECVKIKIPKENKGQFFPDLDLTTKLLARSTNEPAISAISEAKPENKPLNKPLIEELDVSNDITKNEVINQAEEGEKFNWEIQQTPAESEENDAGISIKSSKYGFNDQYDNIVLVSLSNGNDINELGDPESTPNTDRIIERLIKENIKFDPEYYAADYIMEKYPSPDDDKDFKGLIDWKSPTTKAFMKWYKTQQELPLEEREQIMPVEFTKDEQEKMLALPRKSYIIDEDKKIFLLTAMVSLLFSYHFDMRETEGDHNVESAWTVGKLTPQIAFLDSQLVISSDGNNDNLLKTAIITGIRRALSYPLHRNYKLVMKCWDDVYYTLRGGKRLILKCLLDLKELFRYHDVYYVYDKIWMEDICAWLISDHVSENLLRDLAHKLRKEYTLLQKTDITFEKLDSTEGDEDQKMDNDEDEMIVLNLHEIEIMAEELFEQYRNQ